jgi:hypothetical protein
MAIECKWSAGQFDAGNLKVFRGLHPLGENFVVASDVDMSYRKEYQGLQVNYVSLEGLISALV